MKRDEFIAELSESMNMMSFEVRRLKQMAELAEHRNHLSLQDKVIDVREKEWLLQELMEEVEGSGEEDWHDLKVGLLDARRRLETSLRWARADLDRERESRNH